MSGRGSQKGKTDQRLAGTADDDDVRRLRSTAASSSSRRPSVSTSSRRRCCGAGGRRPLCLLNVDLFSTSPPSLPGLPSMYPAGATSAPPSPGLVSIVTVARTSAAADAFCMTAYILLSRPPRQTSRPVTNPICYGARTSGTRHEVSQAQAQASYVAGFPYPSRSPLLVSYRPLAPAPTRGA